jgi:hypothetical protein
VYGPRGGDLLTDDQIRHCYEVNTTTLLIDLAHKATAKAQDRATGDLWQRTRDELELLQKEYIALGRDTSEVVEWLKQEARDWQGIGDQIRQQESDSDSE